MLKNSLPFEILCTTIKSIFEYLPNLLNLNTIYTIALTFELEYIKYLVK